ncbi:hypothetical protein Tco_1046765 [Tanacetum coccineum]
MQDGLSFGITHGKEGRVLTDVVAYNPSTEDDYVSALKDLQQVNFSLLTDLRSNKDASTEAIMDVLRLDDSLAERLDVFIPLVEPISTVALEGMEGTSITAPITIAAITTVVSSGVASLISTNDYEVVGAEEGANVDFD